jgi:hypothetical protein
MGKQYEHLSLKSGAGLPVFMKTGNPSAKSRQLWIARHRRSLAS